jgi:hypothetical protein
MEPHISAWTVVLVSLQHKQIQLSALVYDKADIIAISSKCNLFSWRYSLKIAHLEWNINHSLTLLSLNSQDQLIRLSYCCFSKIYRELKNLLTFVLSTITIFGGIYVAHLFSFLCCPIMCLYVMSSVLWCPLWFPHNDVQFVFTSSCL